MIQTFHIRWVLIFTIVLMATNGVWAQNQSKTKIKILGANEGKYEEAKYGKAKILTGNVRFKQGKTLMYCDSAVLYSVTNSMKAFGNVRIVEKEKKTEMTGDSLIYDGNSKKGKLRGQITLINDNQTLVTHYLDFDIKKSLAYYSGGGVITDQTDQSVLKSQIGYYYSKTQTYFFKDSVSYITRDYEIYSDTMEYNTNSQTVYFHGPTDIISDSSSIYCESGWYNKKKRFSTFSQNVKMTSDEQILTTDSVIYDEKRKIGRAFGNVVILDTTNNLQINGDLARYDNIENTSWVTGTLELQLFFSNDTLHLHSDTLFTNYDSTQTHRKIHAYHHVLFFKPDMQGKCDSLSFSEADSTMRMYRHPVVWTDSNQVTGKEIIIKTYDGVIQNMRINEEAFIVSEEEPGLYNQVKGKSLFAHFKNNEIYRIDVNRSGQTIYYIRDENNELLGMNRLDCSNMSMFIDSLGIDHIKFYKKPSGTFYPMKDVTLEMKLLRYFYWRIVEKPKKVDDIFHWIEVPEYIIKRRQSRYRHQSQR